MSVEDLSTTEVGQIEGKCSWCGSQIGRVKGVSRRRKIQAAALNRKSGVILCDQSAKLCREIVANDVHSNARSKK